MEAADRGVATYDVAAWQVEFEKYKLIPQYAQINAGMTLPSSRPSSGGSGRTVFLAASSAWPICCPSCSSSGADGGARVAAARGDLRLGALQGAVGWWMVASGLTTASSVATPGRSPRACRIISPPSSGPCGGIGEADVERMAAPRGPWLAEAWGPCSSPRPSCRSISARWSPGCVPATSTTPGRDRRRAYSGRRAAVVRVAMVAESVRQHPDGAVQASHDRLSLARRRAWHALDKRDAPALRAAPLSRLPGCSPRSSPGRDGYSDAPIPDAHRPCARPSGHGDGGARLGDDACRDDGARFSRSREHADAERRSGALTPLADGGASSPSVHAVLAIRSS